MNSRDGRVRQRQVEKSWQYGRFDPGRPVTNIRTELTTQNIMRRRRVRNKNERRGLGFRVSTSTKRQGAIERPPAHDFSLYGQRLQRRHKGAHTDGRRYKNVRDNYSQYAARKNETYTQTQTQTGGKNEIYHHTMPLRHDCLMTETTTAAGGHTTSITTAIRSVDESSLITRRVQNPSRRVAWTMPLNRRV